jgi:prophage regulatory protein
MDRQQDTPVRPLDRFLRRAEVESLTGLSRSTIYDKIAAGEFPRPVRLTGGAVAWVESEIAAWQAERIALRDVVRR